MFFFAFAPLITVTNLNSCLHKFVACISPYLIKREKKIIKKNKIFFLLILVIVIKKF